MSNPDRPTVDAAALRRILQRTRQHLYHLRAIIDGLDEDLAELASAPVGDATTDQPGDVDDPPPPLVA